MLTEQVIADGSLRATPGGVAFDIRTHDGAVAHSACVGFGLERIALALFKTHGLDVSGWPLEVRNVLDLD